MRTIAGKKDILVKLVPNDVFRERDIKLASTDNVDHMGKSVLPLTIAIR